MQPVKKLLEKLLGDEPYLNSGLDALAGSADQFW